MKQIDRMIEVLLINLTHFEYPVGLPGYPRPGPGRTHSLIKCMCYSNQKRSLNSLFSLFRLSSLITQDLLRVIRLSENLVGVHIRPTIVRLLLVMIMIVVSNN